MSTHTIKFLSEASRVIPDDCPVAVLLRSNLINNCREVASQDGQVQLEQNTFGPKIMCQRCGNVWTDGMTRCRVKEKAHPSRSVKRLLLKNPKRKSRAYSILEKYKNNCNKLVKICTVCKHKNVENLKRKIIIKTVDASEQNCQKSPVKKKKKHDKFAGLNEKIVKQVQNKQKNSVQIKQINSVRNKQMNSIQNKQKKPANNNQVKNQTKKQLPNSDKNKSQIKNKVITHVQKSNKKSALSKFLSDAKSNYNPISSLQNFFDKLS